MTKDDDVALIADDDEFFRMALRSILADRTGIRNIIETGSLDEALERLCEGANVRIALFDLRMPGMESPSSLAAVRELVPHTRVVVVSASQRREDILAALSAGAHGYVPKGLGANELASALRLILDGTIYVPPSLAEIHPVETGNKSAGSSERDTSGAATQAPRLTPRQRDVLELLVKGMSNKEIARTLDLGEGTVKIHLAAVFRILGVRSRSAAAVAGSTLVSETPKN
jgi:DNA-binding NarL/FixJ family response regulator